MSTNVIDTSFHGATFPSTYTGPGTLIGNPVSDGPDAGGQGVAGYFTSNGNATNILCGFMPTEVEIVNTTDSITWKWQRGMPAADSLKTVLSGPTLTLDTGSQITVSGSVSDGSGGNGSVLLGTTLCGSSKNITYKIT